MGGATGRCQGVRVLQASHSPNPVQGTFFFFLLSFSPIRFPLVGPKGVLSSLDGRLLSAAPAGSPDYSVWFPRHREVPQNG